MERMTTQGKFNLVTIAWESVDLPEPEEPAMPIILTSALENSERMKHRRERAREHVFGEPQQDQVRIFGILVHKTLSIWILTMEESSELSCSLHRPC